MTELQLLQIKDALEKTVKKLLDDIEKNPDFETDFKRVSVLMERLTERCEGNQELAFKLMEFVTKKLHIEDIGEYQYMMNEINKRSRENVV